jgi:hypothetical protein
MTSKGINGKTWVKRHVRQARSMFKHHRMTEVGPGHWRLRNKKEPCFYWCDIVVMGGCGLAVWGDIEGMFFSYYSGAKRPEELVYWMANADPGYYGRQKAHIGMSGPELVDEYVDEVAIYDLRQHLKWTKDGMGYEWDDSIEGGPYGTTTVGSEYTEAINNAIESIEQGQDLTLVKNELYDALMGVDTDAWEWLGSIGRVPSSRLIYCLSAVRRLGQLLRAKEKRDERRQAA